MESPVVSSIRTLALGKEQLPFYLAMERYDLTGQPKLVLVPYQRDEQRITLTLELPMVDLRAYDADFAFKRTHIAIRAYTIYLDVFRALIHHKIIRPTPVSIEDGTQRTARIVALDTAACVIVPEY